MLIANFVVIYIPGLLGLYNFMINNGKPVTITGLLIAGVVPFIVGDLLKIAMASGITTSILPKED